MDEIDNFPTVCSPTNDDFEAVGCAAGPVNPTLEGTTAVCAISCCAMPSRASLYLRVENSHSQLDKLRHTCCDPGTASTPGPFHKATWRLGHGNHLFTPPHFQ